MALNGFAASLFAFGRKANKLKGRHGLWRPLFFAFVVGWLVNAQNDPQKYYFFLDMARCVQFFLYFCRVDPVRLWIETQTFVLL